MKFVILLVLIFTTCGASVVIQGFDVILRVLYNFFPLFKPVVEQNFKDYITSPYFIVGVVIFFCSIIGITISVKGRKILYAIISSIFNIFSIISIINNLVVCN